MKPIPSFTRCSVPTQLPYVLAIPRSAWHGADTSCSLKSTCSHWAIYSLTGYKIILSACTLTLTVSSGFGLQDGATRLRPAQTCCPMSTWSSSVIKAGRSRMPACSPNAAAASNT